MNKRICRFLYRFAQDNSGSVFIFVGLAIIVLVGVVGIALDLGTRGMISTRMQNAADSAALAGALADTNSDAERIATARRFFALNFPDHYLQTDMTAEQVAISLPNGKVLVDTKKRTRKADVSPVAGINTISTRAVSEVDNSGSSSAQIRDITLVMDASGSMGDPLAGPNGSGSTRIEQARNSARILIDAILCNAPVAGSRIGWAQYSTDCQSATTCTNLTTSQALSGSCNDLLSRLSTYNPISWTNGAEGLERAEALMSSARPNVVRAIVYMTDGLNNTYRNVNYCYDDNSQCLEGSGSALADIPARDVCTRLKAQGILIYSIGFSTDARNAQILRDCATAPDYYFYAPDSITLQDAFQQIVTSIKKIRITR
jgi:Flp pilus assembly protein TadG